MVDTGDPLFDNVHKILGQKNSEGLPKIIELAKSDRNFLKEVIDGLVSSDDIYRFNCYQIVKNISVNVPLKLYSEWDSFVELLGSDNAFHQTVAVEIIANLTAVDEEEKFEEIADSYCSLMDGKSVVVARHIASSAGIISQTKPGMVDKITKCLLHTEKTHFKHKELIAYDAIESFDAYFNQVENQEQILRYIIRQKKSSSPKTRKRAEEFLETHQLQ